MTLMALHRFTCKHLSNAIFIEVMIDFGALIFTKARGGDGNHDRPRRTASVAAQH
jgi:hypothetical protein